MTLTGGAPPLPPKPDLRDSPAPLPELPTRRWHYRRSLASRVTLLTTIAVGATVALLSLSVYLVVRVQMQETMDEQLVERAASAAATIDEDSVMLPPGSFLDDIRLTALFQDGRVMTLGSQDPLPSNDAVWDVVDGDSPGPAMRSITLGSQHYRIATVPIVDEDTRAVVGALMLAQSTDSQQRFLGKLGLVMLLFGGTGVLLASVAGTAVARNGLRPVRRLTDAVEDIARTEELTPLHVEGDDEIARLATAFNQMLTSLSASRERQRQLVADASHELKTPLTSLRTNLDLLAQAEQAGAGLSAETRGELIDDVRAQIVELSTLIGDLVELARDEQVRHTVEPVALVEVLDRAVSRVRLRAPSVTFEVRAAPWWVVGDSHGLERAITNLLDNAAKWSPTDGRVVATLANGILTVDDEGPGIPEADQPYVFDRFFRSTDARSMPGSGLGLSIVHQVAERHAGTASAGTSPAGGARLTLQLPGSPLHPSADVSV
ncbi:HAMP domain-containing sensor histidine kinase [Nocardioides zeae]|uniref:histidine kinase n=1 Tax=Nocardioides imazamoxiresistens TaxID=3231893 RepID=A0ABU3PUB6_9ACTN|nr:HAMP domain-containing sensor histidine kinase [Nocardioides zeae]MDT9592822.1 HAMP domain-containing sensor histidine kinase [Nocardioides zeae]